MHLFCPLFNILMLWSVIFRYLEQSSTMIFFIFRLVYGLRVLKKGLKIGPSDCIQMSETSELSGALPPRLPSGALPLDPTWSPTGGPWTPSRFTLRSLRSLRSNFFSTPTSKNIPRAGSDLIHLCIAWIQMELGFCCTDIAGVEADQFVTDGHFWKHERRTAYQK